LWVSFICAANTIQCKHHKSKFCFSGLAAHIQLIWTFFRFQWIFLFIQFPLNKSSQFCWCWFEFLVFIHIAFYSICLCNRQVNFFDFLNLIEQIQLNLYLQIVCYWCFRFVSRSNRTFYQASGFIIPFEISYLILLILFTHRYFQFCYCQHPASFNDYWL
jgi:hypothetical protein